MGIRGPGDRDPGWVAATSVQVARSGYEILPVQLVFNLLWAPYLGVVMGWNLSRTHRSDLGDGDARSSARVP